MKTKRAFVKAAWQLIYPFWLSAEWKIAWTLLTVIVGLNLGIVYLTVLFNDWYGKFYDSLQQKNFVEFKSLILYFCMLAAGYIIGAVYRLYLQQLLTITWRRWLTENLLTTWLEKNRFYAIELFKFGTDNPDQRIAEDLQALSTSTLSLSLGLLSSVTTLVSFFMILWRLSGPISFSLFDFPITIPGYMVWAAFAYAFVGSFLTHLIGRKLITLNFQQQKVEANFRYSLVRTREYADAIALADGAYSEQAMLKNSFANIINNWRAIMRSQKRLTWFTAAYAQAAVIFPLVVGAPRYFSGAIELGALMQISSAFGRVQDALSWFIDSYSGLTEWKASVDRLLGFQQAAATADQVAATGVSKLASKVEVSSNLTGQLSISLPDDRRLKDNFEFAIQGGNAPSHTVIRGASGSGKSTFFRVLAGLWPFASGTLVMPPRDEMMFFPQKPYLPVGTLRAVCTYPRLTTMIDTETLVTYFKELNLPLSAQDIDLDKDWSKHLSGGEQQRLVLIRAVLHQPRWLFLDEATASLDSESDKIARNFLHRHLPQTHIIEIAHRQIDDSDAGGVSLVQF